MTYYIAAHPTKKHFAVVHNHRNCTNLVNAYDVRVLPAYRAKRRKRCRYCFPEEDERVKP